MNKLSLRIDTKKLDKNRIVERTFTNRGGEPVTTKDLKVDVIPLKEKKVITTGDGWKLLKVGFVTETPTQEERKAKENMPIVGEAIQFEANTPESTLSDEERQAIIKTKEAYGFNKEEERGGISPDEIPF
jgi:hypothetical protein